MVEGKRRIASPLGSSNGNLEAGVSCGTKEGSALGGEESLACHFSGRPYI